ncbi:MAG TPA: hypothetical protein DD727_01355 [Clostridiales bacterium]|nr:hypothetical protein [Clostridiales bacterium]
MTQIESEGPTDGERAGLLDQFKRSLKKLELWIDSLYRRHADVFKFALMLMVWILIYFAVANPLYILDRWVLYAGIVLNICLFLLYAAEKSFRRLLLLCSIPFFGVFPLVFHGYWIGCLITMLYYYGFWYILHPAAPGNEMQKTAEEIIFAVFLSTVGILLICTYYLAILSMPFTFLAYYKLKWAVDEYTGRKTVLLKALRFGMFIPAIAGCFITVFLPALA